MFSTVIIANYINKREDSLASFRISEQDEQEIRNLAKDPRIGQKVKLHCNTSSSSSSSFIGWN